MRSRHVFLTDLIHMLGVVLIVFASSSYAGDDASNNSQEDPLDAFQRIRSELIAQRADIDAIHSKRTRLNKEIRAYKTHQPITKDSNSTIANKMRQYVQLTYQENFSLGVRLGLLLYQRDNLLRISGLPLAQSEDIAPDLSPYFNEIDDDLQRLFSSKEKLELTINRERFPKMRDVPSHDVTSTQPNTASTLDIVRVGAVPIGGIFGGLFGLRVAEEISHGHWEQVAKNGGMLGVSLLAVYIGLGPIRNALKRQDDRNGGLMDVSSDEKKREGNPIDSFWRGLNRTVRFKNTDPYPPNTQYLLNESPPENPQKWIEAIKAGVRTRKCSRDLDGT